MAPENQSDERSLHIDGDVEHSSVVLGDGNTVYNTTVFGSFDAEQFPLRFSQRISQSEYRWRQVLIDKVKHYWIQGVLEKSLHHQALIQLGLTERPKAVASPLSGFDEFSEDPGHPFSEGTQTAEIFDGLGAGRTLLILGEPGAGKTTILLKLVQCLLTRMGDDVSQPLPVVLNLSSWSKKRTSIADWLEQELYDIFQVSKPLGKTWIEEESLILCLDGLDEVEVRYRNTCVQHLNQFIQAHGRTELLVCSRLEAYEALSARLRLRSAICIQALSSGQIDRYLEQAGEPLTALKTVFNQNPELKDFAASPLILSVMSLAYQGFAVDEFPEWERPEVFRKQLFEIYLSRMLKRRGTPHQYPDEQTVYQLTWLAQRLMQTSQSVFLIEKLQPFWLVSRPQKLAYKLLFGLIFGVFFGLIGGLNILLVNPLSSGEVVGEVNPLLIAAAIVLILGLTGGYLSGADMMERPPQPFQRRRWTAFRIACFFSLATVLLIGIPVGLWASLAHGVQFGAQLGLLIALVPGLFAGLLGGFLGDSLTTLKLSESLSWQWRASLTSSLMFGLIFSLVFGFFGFFLGSLADADRLLSVLWGIQVGLPAGCLLGALAGGFRVREIANRTVVNQGIRKSLASAMTYGGLFALVFGGGMSLMAFGEGHDGLSAGLSAGLFWGGLIGLKMGGIACIHHISMRLVLYQQKAIPWNYARFLDYAAERLFLQKVGSGYLFIHRMLLEHFAQMEH